MMMQKNTCLELPVGLLLSVETLGLVPEAAPLTVNLGTEEAACFSVAFSLGILAWLRSSSQVPMVAARLASLPLLPRAVSEETGGVAAALFSMESGIQSEGMSQVPVKGQTISPSDVLRVDSEILTVKT